MSIRPNWSHPLPRPISIPEVVELETLADVRALLSRVPKAARAKVTWQYVEHELKKAAATGDTTHVSIALQMVLQLEHVEYETKATTN